MIELLGAVGGIALIAGFYWLLFQVWRNAPKP